MLALLLAISAFLWFGPVHKAHVFLGRIQALKPGITPAKEIEELEREGFVKEIPSGCVGGFASPGAPVADHVLNTTGGGSCYSFIFRNRLLSALRLAPHTGIYGTLTVKRGVLHLIRLSYEQDRLFFHLFDQDCDSCNPDGSDYMIDRKFNGPNAIPGDAYVFLTRKSSGRQREAAYAIKLNLMGAVGHARDGRDLNEAVWRSN